MTQTLSAVGLRMLMMMMRVRVRVTVRAVIQWV
jgi:hypothetical protein